jgi:hypothetical protein
MMEQRASDLKDCENAVRDELDNIISMLRNKIEEVNNL